MLKLSPNLRQIAREKRPEDEVSTSPKKPGGGLNIAKVRRARAAGRLAKCGCHGSGKTCMHGVP